MSLRYAHLQSVVHLYETDVELHTDVHKNYGCTYDSKLQLVIHVLIQTHNKYMSMCVRCAVHFISIRFAVR